MNLISSLKFGINYYLVFVYTADNHGVISSRTYNCTIDAGTLDKAIRIATDHVKRFPNQLIFRTT